MKVVRVSGLTNVGGPSAVVAARSEGYSYVHVAVGSVTTPPAHPTGIVIQGTYGNEPAVDLPGDGVLCPLRQFLTQSGDGLGDIEANGNYVAAEAVYKLIPPGGHVAYVTRLIVSLEDGGALTDNFWGQSTVLTNGIKFQIRDGSGVVHDLLGPGADVYNTGNTWKRNQDIGTRCYDSDKSGFKSGDSTGHARWTFSKAGAPLTIDGAQGEYLAVSLKDDFTSLTHQHFWVEGHLGTRFSFRGHKDIRARIYPDGRRLAGIVRELPAEVVVPQHPDASGVFDVILTFCR